MCHQHPSTWVLFAWCMFGSAGLHFHMRAVCDHFFFFFLMTGWIVQGCDSHSSLFTPLCLSPDTRGGGNIHLQKMLVEIEEWSEVIFVSKDKQGKGSAITFKRRIEETTF